jgi:hypothetical protein
MRRKLTILLIVLLLLFLLPYAGLRLWIALQFNQKGNLFLLNDDSSRIYEMTESGLVVWSFDMPEYPREDRFWLPYPVRLPNGNTLISDADAGPVYEVNRRGDVVWKCDSLYEQGDSAFRWGPKIWAPEVIDGIILAIGRGEERGQVMMIDKDCNIVWKWDYIDDDPRYTEYLSNARSLQNGNMAVLMNKILEVEQWSPPRLCAGEIDGEKYKHLQYYEYIELHPNRNVVRTCNLDKLAFSPNSTFLLSNGHVLASYDQYGVAEFDTLGEEVWSFQPPESVSTTGTLSGKAPMGALGAFRSSNGNTVVYSWTRIFIVDSRGRILRRIAAPTVKSILGLKYVSDGTENEGDRIYAVIGIVDR